MVHRRVCAEVRSTVLMVGSAEVPAFLAPPAISRSRYPTSA
jgi:hypothetical protein